MPVYNVSEFLEKTIDSVLMQDFTNYELLLVDDGSTDDSGLICDNYQELYPDRIKVFHIENSGVANARNFGIERSKGGYLYFMDSDDILYRKDVFSEYYKSIFKSKNVDLFIQGFLIHYENPVSKESSEQKIVYPYKLYDLRKDQKEFISLFPDGFMFVVWNKLFKSEVIKKNQIKFLDKQMEDFQFVLDYIRKIQFIEVLDYIGYVYNRILNKKTLVSKIREGMFEDYISIHRQLLTLFSTVTDSLIHQIMFPQYYSVILKYLNKTHFTDEDEKYLKENMRNSLIKASIKEYDTKSFADFVCFNLIRMRFFRSYRFISFLFR